MPFYQNPIDATLRFGDVIRGFVESVATIENPSLDYKHISYKLELDMPEFCVLLSPCCSIGSATLTLAPIEQIDKNFVENPFFQEDMTNINRCVPPNKRLSPAKFNALSPEEQQKLLESGNSFTFVENFIYEENPILPKYKKVFRGTEFNFGQYLIDFRKSFRVNCSRVRNPIDAPVESKLLQLTVQTRQELREKISFYYSRQPAEDIAILQAI